MRHLHVSKRYTHLTLGSLTPLTCCLVVCCLQLLLLFFLELLMLLLLLLMSRLMHSQQNWTRALCLLFLLCTWVVG